MATQFDAKAFNPEAFGKYVETVPQLRTNELLRSRAIIGNPDIRAMFSSQTGTAFGTIPLYGLINGDTQNYDGITDIESQSSNTYTQGVIVTGRADAWTEKDFSYDITGNVDFMGNVARQVAHYWDTVNQDILLDILGGIYGTPSSPNGLEEFVTKHTFDISGLAGVNNKVGPTTLNSAIQQASGANKNGFTFAIMHSAVATNLENLRLLDYMKYTDQQNVMRDLTMATWNGRTVVVDDSMPVDGDKYTTYVFGEGAFFYENIGAKVPYEMDRNPAKNGGEDTLYSRQRKVFAPRGISFDNAGIASLSPTNAELGDANRWSLVNDSHATDKSYYDHQAIMITRIISKG